LRPHDIGSWRPEERTRLFNSAETNGFRLDDGAVVIVGSNFSARIDVVEPGGAYRWPAARQVVTQHGRVRESKCSPRGNRFTKAVFEGGWRTGSGRQVLVATWGWGGGFPDDRRPGWLCDDIRDYSHDSHEVFFAYSDDGGVSWKNKDGNVRVDAPLCPTEHDCRGPEDGIAYDDPAFQVSRTRQKAHRAIWAHDDGTVYIAYERSNWCDTGGTCDKRDVENPGALMMLTFKPNGPVREVTVDRSPHWYTAGIRKAGSSIYVWSSSKQDGIVYEYRSDDEGETWSKTPIGRGGRVHAATRIPCLDSIRLVFTATGRERSERKLFYYRKTMPPVSALPP
jgi:hypothetical protein